MSLFGNVNVTGLENMSSNEYTFLYVNSNAVDDTGEKGNKLKPFDTITKALAMAEAGDTIKLQTDIEENILVEKNINIFIPEGIMLTSADNLLNVITISGTWTLNLYLAGTIKNTNSLLFPFTGEGKSSIICSGGSMMTDIAYTIECIINIYGFGTGVIDSSGVKGESSAYPAILNPTLIKDVKEILNGGQSIIWYINTGAPVSSLLENIGYMVGTDRDLIEYLATAASMTKLEMRNIGLMKCTGVTNGHARCVCVGLGLALNAVLIMDNVNCNKTDGGQDLEVVDSAIKSIITNCKFKNSKDNVCINLNSDKASDSIIRDCIFETTGTGPGMFAINNQNAIDIFLSNCYSNKGSNTDNDGSARMTSSVISPAEREGFNLVDSNVTTGLKSI